MSARRVRGLSFLASLLLVVVVSPLAAFSVLPWWSVMVVVAALVVDFAWLRHAASTERANRRSNALQRSAIRPTRSPAAARSAAHAPSAPTAQVETMVADPADGATGVAELTEPAAVSPAEVDLSGWAPVPVPPPTYTLKAKAERPEPVPVAVTEPTTPLSSFHGLVDEDELDELLDRRRAAGA